MQIEETPIKDLVIVKPKVFPDDRGFFYETFNAKTFKELGLDVKFVQDNISLSQKGVLRGIHFQKPPYAQGKLVQVLKGAVLDITVDLRKYSPSYGQYFSYVLSEENKTQLYVPEGFGHGFVTLEDETLFSYKCTNFYNKESEGGIFWNDKDLNIDWQIENPIISEKDQMAQSFADFESPF
ncbi:MAG: dTDP-4-dehydrorhamnose 3,5-epimerase [Flavobacteriales bacterium]|nr:dTDP-4-dehydrorhamnose 3,5-epimerase [Flavobacteriales bacterium]|tara:strand:- start:12077 stop:12619 length:543 start_codon:yes stop_codon:yes gene_type:complete